MSVQCNVVMKPLSKDSMSLWWVSGLNKKVIILRTGPFLGREGLKLNSPKEAHAAGHKFLIFDEWWVLERIYPPAGLYLNHAVNGWTEGLPTKPSPAMFFFRGEDMPSPKLGASTLTSQRSTVLQFQISSSVNLLPRTCRRTISGSVMKFHVHELQSQSRH